MSRGACALLQPRRSLCSRETPARLHFTFSFHPLSRPTADKQEGQLCKPPEEDRRAPPPRGQRAQESGQQLVTSVPVSSRAQRLPAGSQRAPARQRVPLTRGGQAHAGAEDNACLPTHPRAGSAAEHHLLVPRTAAGKQTAAPPDVRTHVHTPPPSSHAHQPLGPGVKGSKGREWGSQMYPVLLALAPSHLGVLWRTLHAGM